MIEVNTRTMRGRGRTAIDRTLAALTRIEGSSSPEVLEAIADRFEQAATPSSRNARANRLTGGRAHTPEERMLLEASNLARQFALRRELLKGALSAPEVAALLGTSRQTPHDRVKSGALLAVRDRGGLRFPPWQFDSQRPNGVILGLDETVRTLRLDPLDKIAWLTRPNPYLGGRTPKEALRKGEVDRVVELAHGVAVS
jgi:hypothetical protein